MPPFFASPPVGLGIGHQLRDLTQTRQKDQDSALTRVLEVGVCVIRPCEFYTVATWFFCWRGKKMDPKKVARIFVLGNFFLQKNGGLNLQSTEKRKKVMRISNHHHVIPFFASQTAANGKDNGKREPFQRERTLFQRTCWFPEGVPL